MNVDWAGHGTAAHTDAAFPTLAACLAPVVPGTPPVAVYYYPGRTLQVVHADGQGGLVTRDAPPVGGAPALVGPGERWDPDLRCVLRTFPHDAGLPALPAVVREHGVGADDVLSYLPGLRAVLRVGAPDGPLVLKMGDRATLQRNHERQSALHALAGRGFRTSLPHSVDEARSLRREHLEPGVPLVRALAGGPRATLRAADLARDLGTQVAALHAVDPATDLPGAALGDRSASALLARWQRKTLRTLGRALPGVAPRAGAVLDRLSGAVPVPAAAPGLVHGDLHVANVLCGPLGVVLLDLDDVGRGDPELDVAVLVGRLLLVAVTADRPDLAAFARAVVTAYDDAAAARGARPLRADVLAWYLAGTFVGRQAKTSVRHLAPGLEELCTRLVGLAEVALACHGASVPGTPVTLVVDLLTEAAVPAASRA